MLSTATMAFRPGATTEVVYDIARAIERVGMVVIRGVALDMAHYGWVEIFR